MLTTTGRTDIADYFEKGPGLSGLELSHTPYIAFVEDGPDITVRVFSSLEKLLLLPDSTKVMAQWPGQWRSDFFQFTVGDARVAYNRKMERTLAETRKREEEDAARRADPEYQARERGWREWKKLSESTREKYLRKDGTWLGWYEAHKHWFTKGG